MTLLEKTYNALNKTADIDLNDKTYLYKPQRPTKPVLFNPFNIPHTRKQASQKTQLSKVLSFIDLKKQSRFADGITVFPISTTSKRLQSIWGCDMNIVRAIQFMIRIGLLAEYDNKYQYSAYYKSLNHSKIYAYSYETECKIKEYCKNNDINKYISKNNNRNNNKNNNINNSQHIRDISFAVDEVRFSSKLQLLKPDNWTTTEFENYIMDILYENYPQLEHYQNIADYINEVYYADDYDRQISFKPRFTWNKTNTAITKIGIRATNTLVSVKKCREADDADNILYKDEVLARYGLKYEFDVKSSVPRLTYALNNNVWLDNNIDLYQMMFNDFCRLCPSEATEWNSNTREIFKSLHMAGYFDHPNRAAAHIKRRISLKNKYNKSEWIGLDYLMKSYRDCIINTIGELKYDSEIFMHESCVYMDVTLELLERGLNVWQQYDCWYTDKQVNDIEELVRNSVMKYIARISNNNK